jgi:hypothetical protein
MSFTWQDDPDGATATLEAPVSVSVSAPELAPAPLSDPGSHQITLGEVTSMLLLTRRSARVYEGTLDELEHAYRATLRHNLLLGWWGLPFGLIWTPIWLSRNRAARRALRTSAA